MMTGTDAKVTGMDFKYDILAIAEEAADRGFNAHTLAKKAGITHPTAGKIFRGEQVTQTTLQKVIDVLGLRLSSFRIRSTRRASA